MANVIQVTPQTLRTKAGELKQMNTRFKQEYEALQNKESSINGMWEGEARNEFHNAFQKDMTQMSNFYNAIAQYVEKLNEIATEYENAEKKNLSTAKTRKY